jgi:predicted nicotinamide N-methyase
MACVLMLVVEGLSGLYLTANPDVVRGKHVLEVGAGCGVSGLIAARFAAKVCMHAP